MNPLFRLTTMSVLLFFGALIGNAITVNAFVTLFGYPSCFMTAFWYSMYVFLIYCVLMLFTLYFSLNNFKKLYYIFFLLFGWYIHNLVAYWTYSFINLFITLPNFINLLIFLSIGTGILIQGIYSEKNTTLEKINLKCPELKGKVTIAHLTDIHLGAVYGKEFIQKLVNLILQVNVDFVCITGDMIDGNIRLTRDMIEPFEQIKCPIYFISGNHEDYTWKEEAYNIIDTTNIKRIGNNIINFNNKVNIIGLDYLKDTSIVIERLKNLLKSRENSLENRRPNILLNHVPIFNAKELEKYDIFLFLCGHYHGGHFFPFTLIQFIRDKFVFEGLYNYNNKHYVYCNSGQGTSGPAVRSFSKSQIGIITLEGSN